MINTPFAVQVDDGSGGTQNVAVSLTPKSTNSNILVHVNWFGEVHYNNVFFLRRANADGSVTDLKGTGQSNQNAGLSIECNNYTNQNNNTPGNCTIMFIDDGTALSKWSAAGLGTITYTLFANVQSTTALTTNRSIVDSNTTAYETGYTIMTATEIAG